MSDSLIERINLIIAQCRDSNESAGLWTEIRDEIERLRAENDHVTLLYNASLKSQDKQQAEIERLEADSVKMHSEIRSMVAAWEKSQAEVERLQAALKEAAKSLAEDEQEIVELRAALESIANNTCCEGCQEARRVALAALETGADRQGGCDHSGHTETLHGVGWHPEFFQCSECGGWVMRGKRTDND